MATIGHPEVRIYKRRILRKKERKYALDQEKNKIQEKTITVKKKKEENTLSTKRVRKNNNDQEKKE